jgi:hypothetical protein
LRSASDFSSLPFGFDRSRALGKIQAISRYLFADILRLIAELRPPPAAFST